MLLMTLRKFLPYLGLSILLFSCAGLPAAPAAAPTADGIALQAQAILAEQEAERAKDEAAKAQAEAAVYAAQLTATAAQQTSVAGNAIGTATAEVQQTANAFAIQLTADEQTARKAAATQTAVEAYAAGASTQRAAATAQALTVSQTQQAGIVTATANAAALEAFVATRRAEQRTAMVKQVFWIVFTALVTFVFLYVVIRWVRAVSLRKTYVDEAGLVLVDGGAVNTNRSAYPVTQLRPGGQILTGGNHPNDAIQAATVEREQMVQLAKAARPQALPAPMPSTPANWQEEPKIEILPPQQLTAIIDEVEGKLDE